MVSRLIYNSLVICVIFCIFFSCSAQKKANTINDAHYKEIDGVKVILKTNPWYRQDEKQPKPSEIFIENSRHDQKKLIAISKKYLGIPYLYGGNDPRKGFDCSGYVQFVFRQMEANLPRSTKDQFELGYHVPAKDAQPGDLVYFNTSGSGVSHVGIYIGEMKFIHAPNAGSYVKISALQEPYWRSRFIGVRRIDLNRPAP